MTASGPFAMGPSLAGSRSIHRSTHRSNFTTPAQVSRTSTSFGDNLSSSALPSVKKEVGNTDNDVKSSTVKTENGEYYSDPDEGVEIVDMEDVHELDWMAPDSIRKECQKSQKKVKKEAPSVFYSSQ
jgi:DNA-directed RNA polymerase III subunit RPC4